MSGSEQEDEGLHAGETSAGQKDCSSKEYMCNICYLPPKDPVLTHCGHLFCWRCIYIWSQSIGGCKFCPTCRSRMSIDEVISVLAAESEKEDAKCPPRPANHRKAVKVVVPGMKVNGTRFGSCLLQKDEIDVFSYRTALGLFAFISLIVAMTLKSYFLGG